MRGKINIVDLKEFESKRGVEKRRNDRLPASKRREKIRRLIKNVGLWNVNKSALAREYGVAEVQIRRDVKKIISEIPSNKLRETTWEFFHAYKKAEKEIRKILIEGTRKEKLMAIRELTNLGDKFTKLLEDYGLKDKIAEKIEVNDSNILTYEVIRKALDEIKNEEE